MLSRLTLKVTKFQLPPLKRLGTVVKNILGAIMAPMSNRVKSILMYYYVKDNEKGERTAKGFKKNVIRNNIKHEYYENTLINNE